MRLEVFPEKLLVAPRRIGSAASSDGKETESSAPARLGGDKTLERFAYGRGDRLLALAGDSAQVPFHAFIQKYSRAFHMLYANIPQRGESGFRR